MLETFVVLCGLMVDHGFWTYAPNREYIITDSIARCERIGEASGVPTYRIETEIIVLSDEQDSRTLVHHCGPDLAGCKQSFSVDNRHITAWEKSDER